METGDIRYSDGNGGVYTLRDGAWHKGARRLPDTVFISSQGLEIQKEMLKEGVLTLEEFLANDKFANKGFLYSKTIDSNGQTHIDHTKELSKIVSSE